jgi:hypothetical protein
MNPSAYLQKGIVSLLTLSHNQIGTARPVIPLRVVLIELDTLLRVLQAQPVVLHLDVGVGTVRVVHGQVGDWHRLPGR